MNRVCRLVLILVGGDGCVEINVRVGDECAEVGPAARCLMRKRQHVVSRIRQRRGRRVGGGKVSGARKRGRLRMRMRRMWMWMSRRRKADGRIGDGKLNAACALVAGWGREGSVFRELRAASGMQM